MTSRKHVVVVYILMAFLLMLNAGQFAAYLAVYNQSKALAWQFSQKTDLDTLTSLVNSRDQDLLRRIQELRNEIEMHRAIRHWQGY